MADSLLKLSYKNQLSILLTKHLKIKSMTKIGIIDGPVNPNYMDPSRIKSSFKIQTQTTDIYGDNTNSVHSPVVCEIIKDMNPYSLLYVADATDTSGKISERNVIKAVEWMISNEVKIINMSLGTRRDCDGYCDFCEFINSVHEKFKVKIIVSAGNTKLDDNGDISKGTGEYISCPGCAEQAITVGALNPKLEIDSIMNLKVKNNGKVPDYYANGYVEVYNKKFERYDVFKGTSFAAPIIAGAISKHYYYIEEYEDIEFKTYMRNLCKGILVKGSEKKIPMENNDNNSIILNFIKKNKRT